MGSALPPRGYNHLAVFEPEAPVLSNKVTFLRLGPHSRVLLGFPGAYEDADAHTLPRFQPPQRNPSAEIHHSRVLPSRVTLRPRTYHVPRRFAPSADSLVSFQPGALTGRRPSELYLTEIANASRRGIPSCD